MVIMTRMLCAIRIDCFSESLPSIYHKNVQQLTLYKYKHERNTGRLPHDPFLMIKQNDMDSLVPFMNGGT